MIKKIFYKLLMELKLAKEKENQKDWGWIKVMMLII
jgi:hypothetical protein